MKLFRLLTSLVFSILRTLGALAGIALGLGFMFWLFLDELPLGPVSPALLTKSEPYADMHVHTAGIGAGDSKAFISQELIDSYKFKFYLQAFDVTQEELVEKGDALVLERLSKKITDSKQVNRAVVLAMDGVINDLGGLDHAKTVVYVPNDFVAEETAKYDNLLFGASVNPYRPDAIRHLVRAKRQGAVLVKWIPSIMLIDPSDKALTSFYLALIELDLPLLSHAGQEGSFLESKDELNDPLRLELPLRLGVKVIAAHISSKGTVDGVDNFHRILPLFRKYENLYADISALTQVNRLGYLKKALGLGYLKGRLIYGSDWPLQFFPLVSPWYHFPAVRLADMRFVSKQSNLWDRDVLLKKALGVTEDIFRANELVLKLPAIPSPTLIEQKDSEKVEKVTTGVKKSASLSAPHSTHSY